MEYTHYNAPQFSLQEAFTPQIKMCTSTCRRRRFVKYFYFHVALVQIATSRELHPQIWYKATSKRTFARVHLSTLTSTLRTLLSQRCLQSLRKGRLRIEIFYGCKFLATKKFVSFLSRHFSRN